MLVVCTASVSAQDRCDEDAGASCDDDAGTGEGAGADGGESDGGATRDGGGAARDGGGVDGGSADAGTVGRYDECSCETLVTGEQGTIHLCTESFDPDVCDDFGCSRGTVRGLPCIREEVRLCCEMRSHDLNTHLYEDCDHPNCESGFREQCRDFGGSVSEGACDAPERPDRIVNDDDDSGGCAIASAGGAARAGHPRGLGLQASGALMLLAFAWRRRRSRRSRRRARLLLSAV